MEFIMCSFLFLLSLFLLSLFLFSEMDRLFDLIEAGDLVGLKTRLHDMERNGQSVSGFLSSSRNDKGLTMFLAACEYGYQDIVEFLVEEEHVIKDQCEKTGMSGLHFASSNKPTRRARHIS
jgi:hypothetical protein